MALQRETDVRFTHVALSEDGCLIWKVARLPPLVAASMRRGAVRKRSSASPGLSAYESKRQRNIEGNAEVIHRAPLALSHPPPCCLHTIK